MASDSQGVKMIILTVKLHMKTNFWMNLTGFICGSRGVNVILLHLGEEIKAHLHLNAFQLFSFLCFIHIHFLCRGNGRHAQRQFTVPPNTSLTVPSRVHQCHSEHRFITQFDSIQGSFPTYFMHCGLNSGRK